MIPNFEERIMNSSSAEVKLVADLVSSFISIRCTTQNDVLGSFRKELQVLDPTIQRA